MELRYRLQIDPVCTRDHANYLGGSRARVEVGFVHRFGDRYCVRYRGERKLFRDNDEACRYLKALRLMDGLEADASDWVNPFDWTAFQRGQNGEQDE